MLIFTDNVSGHGSAGRVQFMTLPDSSIAGELELEDWGGFTGFKSMFTSLQLSEQVNAQIQKTLGRRLTSDTFGDNPGQLILSGVSFYDRCPLQPGQTVSRGHGIVQVINYYRDNRLSTRSTPLKVTLQPDLVLRCLLLGIRAQTLSVDQHTYQFALSMLLIPEDQPSAPTPPPITDLDNGLIV